jgi:ferritin
MISKKMTEILNKQINEELYSWYLYLSMSEFFMNQNYVGTANWLKLQANEELNHAMKFLNYLNEVGQKVELVKIETPPAEFGNHLEAFQKVVNHELHITKCINDLADLAVSEKDHATGIFLSWYVKEQVEEVGTAKLILERIKMVGTSTNTLYLLDRELGKRA